MKLRWHDAKAIATYDALDRIHARLTPTPVATQPGNDRGIPGRSPAAIESNVIDLNKSRAALGR